MDHKIRAPVQDVPPPGGYPRINFKRGIGNRGPSGFAIWASMVGLAVWGFYEIGKTTTKMRWRRKESREARMAVLPYLMAEADFHHSLIVQGLRAREAHVMRDVEGWEFDKSFYNNPKRWRLPSNAERIFPLEGGWKWKKNYVTYAPEHNKHGDTVWWGGRKVYEPYRGDVTDKAYNYK